MHLGVACYEIAEHYLHQVLLNLRVPAVLMMPSQFLLKLHLLQVLSLVHQVLYAFKGTIKLCERKFMRLLDLRGIYDFVVDLFRVCTSFNLILVIDLTTTMQKCFI